MTAHKNKVWVVIVSCVDCGQSVNLSFVLISQIINKLWDPNMIFQAEIIGEKNCDSSTDAKAAAKQSFIALFV